MPFTLLPISRNLPAHLAGMIAASDDAPDFSDWTVVLPTLRLGRHFLFQLEKKVGPCHPPRVMTLDRLISFLRLPRGRPVSSARRLLLLRTLLKKGDFSHLGPGMEGLISGFFDELAAAGLSPEKQETFLRLTGAVDSNPFGSENFAEYWRSISAELEKLSGSYREELARMGRCDQRWPVLKNEENPAPGRGEKMVIAGFYDATRVQERFLRRLASRAHFVYQAEDSQAFRPVIDFARRMGHDIAAGLPRPRPSLLEAVDGAEIKQLSEEDSSGRIEIYSLSSLAAEARQAKYKSLQAAARGETVLVVIPHRPEYVNVFSAVFNAPLDRGGEKLRFNSALARTGFADPAVQLLLSLLDLAAGGFSSFDLGNFLLTPGASLLIAEKSDDAAAIEHRLRELLSGEYIEGFKEIIAFLRRESGGKEGEEIVFLKSLADELGPFDNTGPIRIGGWARQADLLFRRCCRLFPAGDLETVIRSRIRGVLAEMEDLDQHYPISETPNELLTVFRKYILAADVSTTPQPLEGVQLIHILEARSIPADCVIICGMNEGEFPAALPSRLLEDPFIRSQLGLISPEHLESLEELNFFSLLLQAGRVVLTRSPQAIREEEAESRFLTRLKLAGCDERPALPVGSYPDHLLQSYREDCDSPEIASLKKELKNRRPTGFFPEEPAPVISLGAYQAGIFLNCPARYFLESAGIEPGLELLEQPDSLYEGTILHRIAAALWERIREENGKWDIDRIAALCADLGSELIPDSPGFTYLRLMMSSGGWRRFARSVCLFLRKFSPREWESSLWGRFTHRGQTFSLSGRVDLIGEGSGEEIIVDLKRNTFPTKKSVEELREPQLPFYSLCRRLLAAPPERLAYCSFLKKSRGYLELAENNLGEELKEKLKTRADRISADGGYRSLPGERTCRYCPYAGICRAEETVE